MQCTAASLAAHGAANGKGGNNLNYDSVHICLYLINKCLTMTMLIPYMYLCIYVPVLGSQLNKHIFLGGTVQLQMSTCKELD